MGLGNQLIMYRALDTSKVNWRTMPRYFSLRPRDLMSTAEESLQDWVLTEREADEDAVASTRDDDSHRHQYVHAHPLCSNKLAVSFHRS